MHHLVLEPKTKWMCSIAPRTSEWSSAFVQDIRCRSIVILFSIYVVAESYCFLFHGKCAKNQTCATCQDDPYLVLGLICHPCRERKTRYIATLQVEHGEAKTVRCPATQDARRLHDNHLELFQGIGIIQYVCKCMHTQHGTHVYTIVSTQFGT